jgi:hypothetical protein
VNETLATGAEEVRFRQPIVSYAENFLGFSVGGAVPAGYYDRAKAAWIASDNGRIIKINGVTNSRADLDITAQVACRLTDSQRLMRFCFGLYVLTGALVYTASQ